MEKEVIRTVLTIMIIVSYFTNLLIMFCYEPLLILIVNFFVWVIILLIFLGIGFVDWLNN